MAKPPHILVVDDEIGILESLERIFAREGYRVTVKSSGSDALDILRTTPVDLVLADVMMPAMGGIELLQATKAISPGIEVVMMTAFGTVEKAVECMRAGAYDFIAKPLKRAIVSRAVQRTLERRALIQENQVLRANIQSSDAPQEAVLGQAEAWRQTCSTLKQAATSPATILLTGESGTGKEVLARTVHAHSGRQGAFVAINCAALPQELLESELFGHEKGAFTGADNARLGRFERAHGGTLLLDEIAETTPALQVRLLRVLQEGEIERVGGQTPIPVDVRVIAATHRDIEDEVRQGRLREDLYYRLNVIHVNVPPLRKRPGDALLLAHAFMRRFAKQNQRTMDGITESAAQALEAYGWPGNVRELQNAIERAVVLGQSNSLALLDLPQAIQNSAPTSSALASGLSSEPSPPDGGMWVPFGTPLEMVERMLIQQTLERTGGDKKTAARLLGIAARTIYRKLEHETEADPSKL